MRFPDVSKDKFARVEIKLSEGQRSVILGPFGIAQGRLREGSLNLLKEILRLPRRDKNDTFYSIEIVL